MRTFLALLLLTVPAYALDVLDGLPVVPATMPLKCYEKEAFLKAMEGKTSFEVGTDRGSIGVVYQIPEGYMLVDMTEKAACVLGTYQVRGRKAV